VVKVDGGDIKPLKLGLQFLAYAVFRGFKGFGRRGIRQAPLSQFRETLAKYGFAFTVELTGSGVEVGDPSFRGVYHHFNALFMVVYLLKTHSPKTQEGNLFTRLPVIPVNHHSPLVFVSSQSQNQSRFGKISRRSQNFSFWKTLLQYVYTAKRGLSSLFGTRFTRNLAQETRMAPPAFLPALRVAFSCNFLYY
jgi:hypothetical protein